MKKVLTGFAAFGAAMALIAGIAMAAEIDTYISDVSSDVTLPTVVGIGDNSFNIEVWAGGTYNQNNNSTNEVQVVNRYVMATDGVITPDATSTTTVTFSPNHNYNTNQAYCSTAPIPAGCAGNPFDVAATLVVAAGTPNNQTGTLLVSMTGSQGLEADPSPDTAFVKVEVSTSCTFSDIRQPINVTSGPDFAGISAYKYGARGVVPVKFQLTCGTNLIDTQAEADSHPVTLALSLQDGVDGDNQTSLESPTAGSANSGNLFRFDDGADQYIYNRAIQGLNKGTWKLTASSAGATDGVAYFLIK